MSDQDEPQDTPQDGVVFRPRALGRLHATDDRDKLYPMRAVLRPRIAGRTTRYWSANGWWGDQGQTSMCVGYGWAAWVEDGPVGHPGKAPILAPTTIYHEAQSIDEWAGKPHDGTSVRAGAKVVQKHGLIVSYHWAVQLQEVVQALLTTGPVVVGTNWYDAMFEPNKAGIIHVAGALAGGHCYVLDGINTVSRLLRVKNSWGRSWGKKGFASITFADFERLLHEDGEACLAIEKAS